MFCKNCGNKLEEGTLFCGNCGGKVDGNNEGTEEIILQGKGKYYNAGKGAIGKGVITVGTIGTGITGIVTLTNKKLTFHKSKINIIKLGLSSLLAESKVSIPINTISFVSEIYISNTSAGFTLQTANGDYKFSFNGEESTANRTKLISYINK